MFNNLLVECESEGYVRKFIDEGAPAQELLTFAIELKTAPLYAEKILKSFEKDLLQKKSDSSATASGLPDTVHPLSPRELEVLQLIQQGLSNDEIGQNLYISLSTVKGHNRQIFEKLQVQRRTEAVAKARSLGILSAKTSLF